MLEYNEKDSHALGHVRHLQLDPRKPENAIYAHPGRRRRKECFSPGLGARYDRKRNALEFPPESRIVPAVNITKRYMKLASSWAASQPEYVPAAS